MDPTRITSVRNASGPRDRSTGESTTVQPTGSSCSSAASLSPGGVDGWLRLDERGLAGAAAEAEREFRGSVELLVSLGEESHRGSNSGYRGEALCMLGRYDEAEQAAATCRRLATEDDAVSQVMWRRVESKVLGSRGDADRAVMLAREAVARAANTDNLELHGGALRDLATSLRAANQLPNAARAAEKALELFERKGNLVATESVQALVAEFRSA